jgi:protein O-GlcNAc transferase
MTPLPDKIYAQGVASFRGAHFKDAERLFKEVLRLNPQHVGALNLLGIVFTHEKKYKEAADYFEFALKINPNSDVTLYNYGVVLKALKRPAEALRQFTQALSINPDVPETWNNRGTVLIELGNFSEALIDFEKSIFLNTHYSEAYCNKGKSLFELKRHEEALAAYEKALVLKPNLSEAWLGRGNVASVLNRFHEAFESYDKALALKPQLHAAWLGRGNILSALKRLDDALEAYENALRLDPAMAAAWVGRGNVLFEQNRYDEAFEAYDKALALDAELAPAWVGRGNLFTESRRYADARATYDKAVALNPNLAEAWLGIGNVLLELKHYDQALAAYNKALKLKSELAAVWLGLGNVWFCLKRYEEAFYAYDKAFALNPDLQAVEGLRLHAKSHICDWANFDTDCVHLISAIRSGKPTAGPFQLLSIPSSPKDQLECAKLWAAKYYLPTKNEYRRDRRQHDRIRIAYLSADFRQHPVSLAMVGVFEHHDRSLFETTAISCGANDGSKIRKQIEASFDQFIDVQADTDNQIATLIRDLEIDILVDMMGYTFGSRAGVFAQRPAPIQVNYFGYAGTTGAKYIDYLIADQIVIPKSQRGCYSEKIIYLPNSFMPPNQRRAISDRAFTRANVGLPKNGFVFCSFNNMYKFTPSVFDSWMRILRQVDGSVLWLLETNSKAEYNLRREVDARGVDAERLIFAKRAPADEHLARHHLADLFLDTLPYSAHTTASEALLTGLPLLTCIGETYPGRVAASLLTAIDLGELVATTAADYERTAIELAVRPEKLAAIKQRLLKNQLTTRLFDVSLFTRHLEQAYSAVYTRHKAGLEPDHISISN